MKSVTLVISTFLFSNSKLFYLFFICFFFYYCFTRPARGDLLFDEAFCVVKHFVSKNNNNKS